MEMNSLCEICDYEPAIIYCIDCPRVKLYCNEDFKMSHKTDAKKSHKTETYKPASDQTALPPVVFCSKHVNKEKEFVCSKDNESVCGECIVSEDHKGHEVMSFEVGFNKESKEFKTALPSYEKTFKTGKEYKGPISTFLSKDITALKKMRAETDAKFQALEEAIKQKKAEVLCVIDTAIEKKINDKQFIDDLEAKTKKTIDECVSIIDKCKRFTCASYDFLRNKSLQLKRLSSMVEVLIPLKELEPPIYSSIETENSLKTIKDINISKEALLYKSVDCGEISISNIIKKYEEFQLIGKWLREVKNRSFTSKLLWRGSTDGFGASVFHSKCDNKGPTITIVQSNNDKIFGGFISVPWHSNGGYIYDSTAFLFSLSNKVKCNEQLYTLHSMYGDSRYGPTFGSGYDICICGNCNTNSSSYANGNNVYKLPPGADVRTFYAGSYTFIVKEIEVYSITFN